MAPAAILLLFLFKIRCFISLMTHERRKNVLTLQRCVNFLCPYTVFRIAGVEQMV